MIKLSILIPAYNFKKGLKTILSDQVRLIDSIESNIFKKNVSYL